VSRDKELQECDNLSSIVSANAPPEGMERAVGDYICPGLFIISGIWAIYFGIKNPKGDQWGSGGYYVFGGLVVTGTGLALALAMLKG